MFPIQYGTYFSFQMHFELSSAICFSLDQSEIFSSGNELKSSRLQVDGLPLDCDIRALCSLVSSFGAVQDYQDRVIDMNCSVRFRYVVLFVLFKLLTSLAFENVIDQDQAPQNMWSDHTLIPSIY